METQVAIAVKDVNQRLQVKIPTQHAFGSQQLIAEVLQIPASKINVTAIPAGGSFGAKIENIAAFYASILAWHIEKPVKLKFSREEEFLTSTPRHPAVINHKTGVKKDGSLMAWQSELIFDTGAYAWAGPAVTGVATMFAAGPYRIPNLELVGHCVYTNKVPNGAFRGYGNPQAAFAHESQIDIIAKDLGIDPIKMRLQNAVKDGDKFTLGYPYRGVTLEKTLKKAASESQWDLKKKAKWPGIGVACIQHVTGGLPSAISLKGNLDGTIELMSGMPEIGTGVTSIAPQIVSHELSIPIEWIHCSNTVKTDSAPFEYGLGISRSCFNIGNAAIIASAKFKDKIIAMASDLLQRDAKYLKIINGYVHDDRKGKDAKISLKQIFQKAHDAGGGPILVEGTHAYPLIKPDPDAVEGMPLPGFPQFTFGTQIAELEVDKETGQINILRITAVHDVGKAINPSTVKGQIFGGVVQGIGYALTESLCFDQGIPINDNLLDYKILGVEDIPEINALLVEEPDPEGPHGAKGIGEPPIVATAAAIVNAVENAAAVRIKKLPLTPEIILNALKENKKKAIHV
jgi:carbon-monoxide dehydrogenase large subunit